MRAETWMDHEPPKIDPIVQARQNLAHWATRCRSLEDALDCAMRERRLAADELDRLEGVMRPPPQPEAER